MLKQILFLFLTFLLSTSIFAVEENDSIQEPVKEQVSKENFYGPTVGLGLGMIKF